MDARRSVRQVGVAATALLLAWALALLGGAVEAPELESVEAASAAPNVPAMAQREPTQAAPIAPPPRAAPEPDRDAQAQAHPHPITAEHRHLQHELQLIAALNDALDREDTPALRELVARYAQHDPADTQGLQQGYRQLADCLDQPGPATTEAAQAYYERERVSVLRRYIRRTCLERAP